MKCREIGKSAGNPLNLLPPVDRKAFRDAIITISIASASDQKISHAVSTIHDQFTPVAPARSTLCDALGPATM